MGNLKDGLQRIIPGTLDHSALLENSVLAPFRKQVAVDTSGNIQLVAGNPRRYSIVFVNMTASTVTVDNNSPAAAATGTPMFNQGSVLSYNAVDDPGVVQMAFFAIGSVASTVAVYELVWETVSG